MGFTLPIAGVRADDDTQVADAPRHDLADEFEKSFSNSSPDARAFLEKLRKLERQHVAYRALIRTAQQTSQSAGQLDLRKLAGFALDQGLRLVGAERGLLVLRDRHGRYQVMAASHLNLGSLREDSEISRSILDRVIETGEPLITTNVRDDPRFGAQRSVLALSIRSVLAVPLSTQEGVKGAFYLDTQISTRVFDEADLPIIEAFANITASAIGLVEAVEARDELYLQLVQTLVDAVEAKDPYTAGHSDRVGIYARAIVRALGGDERRARQALIAGYLHDIGKIGINDAYVNKPGRLEAHEWQAFRHHTIIGEKILGNVQALSDILPAVRWHHERLDGSGYPDGIAGADIPFLARVLSVADAYDAMTSDRSYRRALSREQAVSELRKYAGTQFDAQVVEGFLRALEHGSAEVPDRD